MNPRTRPACGLCDGTGYIETEPTHGTYHGQPTTYTHVVNCRCTRGRNSWNAGTPPHPDEPTQEHLEL